MLNNECFAITLQLPNCEDIEILEPQYTSDLKMIISVL
jgi:hypothetical protein